MTQYLRRLAGTAPAFAALAFTVLVPASLALAAAPASASPLVALPARHDAPVPAHYLLPGFEGPGDDELAGSAAGAGREHPGRPATEPADPEAVLASRPLPLRPRTAEQVAPPPRTEPSPPPPPRARAMGTGVNERAADLAAHILPLGTGFALMGVGLGYMGVRLRRG
ncbi:hypothetical protein ABZY31_00475 [Streptomyces sp. NPDC006529]|uniref:hypothetical protein n=1 Tax=Streptomyces sp. NPDC006529 TaxID=3157177 RepID=UPI0033A1DD1D